MRSITKQNLARLTNGKLISFAQLVDTEVGTLEDERVNVIINRLEEKSQAMESAMMLDKTTEMTSRIEEIDSDINANMVSLRKLSSLLPGSSVEAIADAGAKLKVLVDKYGNFIYLPYEDKSAKLKLFLQDVGGVDLSFLKDFGFSYLESLKSDSEAFESLYLERNSFREARKAKVEATRAELVSVLCLVIKYAESLSGIDDACAKIIGDLKEFMIWNLITKKDSSGNEDDSEAEDDSAVVNGTEEDSDSMAS